MAIERIEQGALDSETRAFVQEKARAIHARLKRTAEDIIAIGRDLIEVKARLLYGHFVPWLQSEFDMTPRSAQRFMQVAEKFGSRNDKLSFLPASVLYELASPSTSEAIIQMVETRQIPATISAIREAKREQSAQESEEEPLPELTEEDRYLLAVDTGTLEYYHDDLRREAIQRDREQREEAMVTKSATLTALQSSESNEWYTPAPYIEAVRLLMGAIDVDPASCEEANRIVQAERFYTKKDDGLNQPWHGRVWLNPPYGFDSGSNQERWSRALIERFEVTHTVTEAVLLVNANTEAKWFQPLYNYLICFTNHRIRFYNSSGDSSQPTQGNALVYFGRQEQRFIEIFRQFGMIVRRVDGS